MDHPFFRGDPDPGRAFSLAAGGGRGHRAQSIEHRAKSKEQRAKSEERRADRFEISDPFALVAAVSFAQWGFCNWSSYWISER